jgi:hypothetical protein
MAKIPGVVEEIKSLLTAAKLIKPVKAATSSLVVHDDADAEETKEDQGGDCVDLTSSPVAARGKGKRSRGPVISRIEEDFLSEPVPVKSAAKGATDDGWAIDTDEEEEKRSAPSKRKKMKLQRASFDSDPDDEGDDDILFGDGLTKKKKKAKPVKPAKNTKKSVGSMPKEKSTRATEDEDEVDEDDDDDCVDEAAIAWKRLLNGSGTKARGKHGSSGEKTSSSSAKKNTHKIIVFAHHKEVMNALEDCFREFEVSFIRVDGEVTQAKRDALIRQFQEDDATDIALLSVTSCGVGLNLTRASIAVFAELSWSHGSILQAEDRIHRLGQTADLVRVIYIVARDTSDEIMWRQMQAKHDTLSATLGE